MCGFAGFWDRSCSTGEDRLKQFARAMSGALKHRGPDDRGVWTDAFAGLGLGHQRLAIIDLSAAGRQPMVSHCGRYVLVYNGEIYNHQSLQRELEDLGHPFRGHCDAETLLNAVVEWGVEAALERLGGMFAFAVWDTEGRRLFLVRDRLGIKPLYYGVFGRIVLFGSELKALRACTAFQPEIDRSVLALYLENSYIPSPCSIYKGVRKLPPGCLVALDANGEFDSSRPVEYWSAREAARRGAEAPFPGTADEAADALQERLTDAVKLQRIADVPVGAFLSGGIDSSAVVAAWQSCSPQPVRTFTIGFDEPDYDESRAAERVAAHLNVEHQAEVLSMDRARRMVPQLARIYDEPFGDSSQIPTCLLAEFARKHVKVCISGDGGDELFGGYPRYLRINAIYNRFRRLPFPLRRAAALILEGFVNRWLRRRREPGLTARLLRAGSLEEFYLTLHRHWTEAHRVVSGGDPADSQFAAVNRWTDDRSFLEAMMLHDTMCYLPDDILTKVDRASMAVGLEVRVPILDHRLVEFAWSLPLSYKLGNGGGKLVLRRVLQRSVPAALLERPKQGFGVPIDEWLRGGLRDWAEGLLDESRLRSEGYFDPAPIRRKWDEHLAGTHNWQYDLWDVLMFQAWLEEWR